MSANLIAGAGLLPVEDILRKTRQQELITTEDFDQGTVTSGFAKDTRIIFILKGGCALRVGKTKEFRLRHGSMLIIPIASKYTLRTTESVSMASFHLNDSLNHKELYEHIRKVCKPGTPRATGSALQMEEKLWMFLTSTLSFVQDGLSSIAYQEMKIGELFHVLGAYFSSEALSKFLSPLFSRNCTFAALVYDNWSTAANLEELASLSNLSLSGFSKRFKKVFGMAPYQWIVEQKGRLIINDLLYSDKSIKEITTRYGFYSVQHFGYYCKQKYGYPPGKLRKLVKS